MGEVFQIFGRNGRLKDRTQTLLDGLPRRAIDVERIGCEKESYKRLTDFLW